MDSQVPKRGLYRFGLFEADTHSGVLLRQKQRVKIQEQPFRLLVALLEQPGEIVTREFLRQRLWPENTFVEFDQSFGTAITKLRQALGDDADNPRFIETVPRRGYRFIAPVTIGEGGGAPARTPSSAPGVPVEAMTEPLPTAIADPAAVRTAARSPYLRWLALAIGVVVLLLAGYTYRSRKSFALTDKDTVVLADFQNTTGDPVFDDALRQGLVVALGQSTLIQTLSDRRRDLILKQMNHPPDVKITGKAAVELCQRSGSKVVVEGSISNLGPGYMVGLAGVRCDTGEPIFHEEAPAKSRDSVISTLGEVAARARKRLGESLASIQQHDLPLEQATTGSLEALQAYSLALSVWNKQGDEVSLPYFRKAVQLDPNFAMAYAALGTIYHNLNEASLARENATKAFELRDRLTDHERMSIEARYYRYVTGEQEKAAQVYASWVNGHPTSAGAMVNLAGIYSSLGKFDLVAKYDRESLRADPNRANSYADLATALLALNQTEEAAGILADAEKRGFHTDYLLQANYWLAFVRKDPAAMQQIFNRAMAMPEAKPLLLLEQSNTDAYGGQLTKAHELTAEAASLMEKAGEKETAATSWAVAACREAEAGNFRMSRQSIAKASALSENSEVLALIALAAARGGDLLRAQRLTEQLQKENPSDTLMQGYWLPAIRAQMALQKKDWAKAVEDLAPAESLELGGSQGESVNSLYPAFLRGQAYLAGGDATRAAAEFQKLMDHRGIVLNFPLGALAYLGRGRAYALAGDAANAKQDYETFLALWKNADADLVLLAQAKSEYAKLP